MNNDTKNLKRKERDLLILMREKKEGFCVFSNSFFFIIFLSGGTRDTGHGTYEYETQKKYLLEREREREREREIACVNECSECITKEYKTENGRSTL